MPPSKRSKSKEGEPRRARRITHVLPAECRILSFGPNRLAPHPLDVGDVFGGRTINISRTGLQLHSDYELDPKTVVELTLSPNESGRPQIHLSAEVAWARRNAFDLYGRWAMGMHFRQANTADLALLGDYVREGD